jgi:hypothetical protein
MAGAFAAGVAAIGITYFVIISGDRSDFLEKEVIVVMRGIGHEILLKAGDSTSRVLPVKRMDAEVFQIEFQGQFTFVPDTLVNLVHTQLAAGHLPLQYIVNVMDCSTHQIVYGYQFGVNQTTLVPCLGRKQPKGCYNIQISFSENPTPGKGGANLFLGISLAALLLTFFIYWKLYDRKKHELALTDAEFTPLGKYSFYADRRLLKNGSSTISLTDKESKLLRVLAANQNLPMDRDRLLKEVWEDDGVFVGRSLDMFISKLRKKLLHDEAIRIVNIHGKGYKLEVD